jgi:gas vesicle protein
MLQREESRHDFAFIAGVVIGAIAGALVTLALAPMSGDQTREAIRTKVNELPLDDLKHKADDIKEKAAERASEVAHQAQPVMDKVKTQVSDIAAKTPLKSDNDAEATIEEVAELVPPASTNTATSS